MIKFFLFEPIDKELKYFYQKNCYFSSEKYEFGIRDPGSGKNLIPDPQHCPLVRRALFWMTRYPSPISFPSVRGGIHFGQCRKCENIWLQCDVFTFLLTTVLYRIIHELYLFLYWYGTLNNHRTFLSTKNT
jgi:hypothetical protein